MDAFANALRQLPSIIAENGGYDSAQLVSELRALHATGKNTMGLNMNEVLLYWWSLSFSFHLRTERWVQDFVLDPENQIW